MLALRYCQSDWSSVRRPRFLSRLSSPTLGVAGLPRSVSRRGSARRSEKWRYTHLQREGDEHSGSGNRGAASLKKRLSRSPATAEHAKGPATTLTACHGCLIDAGCFVFAIIRPISFAARRNCNPNQRASHYAPRSSTAVRGVGPDASSIYTQLHRIRFRKRKCLVGQCGARTSIMRCVQSRRHASMPGELSTESLVLGTRYRAPSSRLPRTSRPRASQTGLLTTALLRPRRVAACWGHRSSGLGTRYFASIIGRLS